MKDNNDGTTEIFAIWEYDSYEQYKEIESKLELTRCMLKEYMIGMKTWRERICFKGVYSRGENEELVCTIK